MDYLARAMRVEEIPLLNKQYEEHLVLDKQFWEEQEEERVTITHFLPSNFVGVESQGNS